MFVQYSAQAKGKAASSAEPTDVLSQGDQVTQRREGLAKDQDTGIRALTLALSHWERSEPKAYKGWFNVCIDMNSRYL